MVATSTDWTEEAERAIGLCEQWAAHARQDVDGRLLLFGSAIYKGGEQFDAVNSDLDIVYVFMDGTDALERLRTMKLLRAHKQKLELDMLPVLARLSCDIPGVSVVPITDFELLANIHKGGARSFFDKNFFYDLSTKEQHLGILRAGTRTLPDEQRQAIEYAQKVRNEYLSMCANGTGGLGQYVGTDPLPKGLLRSAAQLIPNLDVGEWYDTRLGLEFMHSLLSDRRTLAPQYKVLFDKTSVRRGGRGQRKPLSDDEQLLLAELLFDAAAKDTITEKVVTWELRVAGDASSLEDIKKVVDALGRLVPDAKLVSVHHGSIILRVRSSLQGFELVEQLHQLAVLGEVLQTQVLTTALLEDAAPIAPPDDGSRLSTVLKLAKSWSPGPGQPRAHEEEFAAYLEALIQPGKKLSNGLLLRNVRVTDTEVPFEMDFLVSWGKPDGTHERIGIELVHLKTSATFFYKIAQLLPLRQPVILVLLGSDSLFLKLHNDLERLSQLNGNVRVVLIESPPELEPPAIVDATA